MKHYTVTFHPENLTAVIHKGASLLEAAEQAGIILATPCGGQGRCGKCKVVLLPAEKEVLACNYIVEHDLKVLIPPSSLYFKQQILEHGITHQAPLEPSLKKIYIEGPCSTIDAYLSKISSALDAPLAFEQDASSLVENCPRLLQNAGSTAVLVSRQNNVLPRETTAWSLTGIEPADTSMSLYGIAVDIGTTTVVARLVDLTTAQIKTTVSCSNPQAAFGGDVISRITYSEKPEGLLRLQKSIVTCLNTLISEAAEAAAIDRNEIYELVAAGNTTMNHLFLGYPVSSLGQAPYRAYSLLETSRRPAEIGIQINPAGSVYTMANVAGFIGSDTVAAALACQLEADHEITLLVDIGTNGEIVLAAGQRLTAASCAAGPALEGAGISFGSRAQSGAIERVVFDGETIDVDVIGGISPSSICGSGLIDAAAVLLNLGIVDPTGRIVEPDELNPMLSPKIRSRLVTRDHAPAFILSGDTPGKTICITQKDIRQIQLAKAAIHTGIQLLLQNAEIKESQVSKLLLAGAFGNYIDKANAVRIGLLPAISIDKIHFVGNAAGTGAEMVLISCKARKRAVELAREIMYLEIAHQREFQAVFSDSLLFPEK